jgi:tetratricopeptide (TPR) repeat protein
MYTNTPNLTEEDSWLTEQKRWTVYYERHVRERLVWATNHVYQYRRQPTQLADHLSSLLVLLRQAHIRPDLHSDAMELISALHPWPLHWGNWGRWEEEIRFAIQVAGHLGQASRQAEFLDYLADILFRTGRFEDAVVSGNKAISLARISHTALHLVGAGGSTFSALLTLGRTEEAVALLQEIEGDSVIQEVANDARISAIARLGLQRVFLFRHQSRFTEAVAEASKVIGWLDTLLEPDFHLIATAYRDRSSMLRSQGDYSAAAKDLRKCTELFAHAGDSVAETLASSDLGMVYWHMAELGLAEAAIRHSIYMAERLNAHWELTRDVGNLGLIYLSRGELQQALIYIERQLALATRLGDAVEMSRAQGNRGIVRLHMKEYDAARQDLEADAVFVKAHSMQEELACNYVNLSRCYAELGEHKYALWLAEQALSISKWINSAASRTVALRCWAEYQSPEQQTAFLRQALTLAQTYHRRFDEAACLLKLSSLIQNNGEQSILWNQGVRLLEEIGAVAWLNRHSPDDTPCLPLLM